VQCQQEKCGAWCWLTLKVSTRVVRVQYDESGAGGGGGVKAALTALGQTLIKTVADKRCMDGGEWYEVRIKQSWRWGEGDVDGIRSDSDQWREMPKSLRS